MSLTDQCRLEAGGPAPSAAEGGPALDVPHRPMPARSRRSSAERRGRRTAARCPSPTNAGSKPAVQRRAPRKADRRSMSLTDQCRLEAGGPAPSAAEGGPALDVPHRPMPPPQPALRAGWGPRPARSRRSRVPSPTRPSPPCRGRRPGSAFSSAIAVLQRLWNALRPEIRPMPPARLLMTAVFTASNRSFSPRRAARVDQARAAHVAVRDLVAREVDRVRRRQLASRPSCASCRS